MKTPNLNPKSLRSSIVAWLAPACAAIFLPYVSASNGKSEPPRFFDIPLFEGAQSRIEGVLCKKEFVFKIPAHIRIEPGSELNLEWHGSPLLLPDVSTLRVEMNRRALTSVRLGSKKDALDGQDRGKISIPIPDDLLQTGWNRLVVDCLLQTTQSPCRDVDNPASWVEVDAGSGVRVSSGASPIFPELQRFPESLVEPVLMNLAEFRRPVAKGRPDPVVSLLVPPAAGEAELRSLLIASARIGQSVYTPQNAICVGNVESYGAESLSRNGILIGLRENLSKASLPQDIQNAIASLTEGEGLIAEAITGSKEAPHRWIIVTGADSTGLENAALTLGSAPAMRNVPSNPWVVTNAPSISPVMEKLAQPPVGPVALDSLRDGAVTLRGLFRNETSRDIHFPPGYETTPGGFVDLDLAHSGALEKTSAAEVRWNDFLIGSVPLTPQNASGTRQRLAIPAGITGRDPSKLSLSSYLDIGLVDCAHRNDERAWMALGGNSTVDIHCAPVVINDLSRLGQLCLRDAFLRRAAIVVPASGGEERNELLKAIGMHLGRQLSDMPVLWPQVATYTPAIPPDPTRLNGRSGLILGSAFEWPSALGNQMRLAVEGAASASKSIMLRGEAVPASDFDPSLVFVQLVPSPWSKGELFAAMGGVYDYGGVTTLELLSKPEISERLAGTVAAVDAVGRVITYDVRFIQEVSLSHQIRLGFSSGVTPGDIDERRINQAEAGFLTNIVNYWIAGAAFAVMAGIYLIQRILLHRRKKHKTGEGR